MKCHKRERVVAAMLAAVMLAVMALSAGLGYRSGGTGSIRVMLLTDGDAPPEAGSDEFLITLTLSPNHSDSLDNSCYLLGGDGAAIVSQVTAKTDDKGYLLGSDGTPALYNGEYYCYLCDAFLGGAMAEEDTDVPLFGQSFYVSAVMVPKDEYSVEDLPIEPVGESVSLEVFRTASDGISNVYEGAYSCDAEYFGFWDGWIADISDPLIWGTGSAEFYLRDGYGLLFAGLAPGTQYTVTAALAEEQSGQWFCWGQETFAGQVAAGVMSDASFHFSTEPAPTSTPEPTATPEPTPTSTAVPTATPEPTPTPTAEPTATPEPTTTPTSAPTATPEPTPTPTAEPTATPEPTPTPTAEPTVIPEPTPTPTSAPTATPEPTPTPTAEPTATPVPTPTPTAVPTATPTAAPTATAKPTATPEPTERPVVTSEPWPTDTPAPTDAPAPTDLPVQTSEPWPTEVPATPGPSIGTDVQIGNNAPAVSLPMEADALAEAVLTEEERQMAEAGADVRVGLSVEDAAGTVSEEDRQTVTAAAGEHTVGQYLELGLFKTVNGTQTAVSETAGRIPVVIQIPEALRGEGMSDHAVLRLHEGETEILQDQDNEPETVTIMTDRFSLYALIYRQTSAATPTPTPEPEATSTPLPETTSTPEPVATSTPEPVATAAPPAGGNGGGPSAPRTGDETPICLWLGLLALSSLGVIATSYKLKRR